MEVGYVVKEANPEYFFFVVDPEKLNFLSIGGVVKIYINNTPFFALIEDLSSLSIEEERLFDYEAIDYLYGKVQKSQYLILGKAIFIGCIRDGEVLPEKPQIPPLPGNKIFLPTEEEIEKLYSFEDKRFVIPIGMITLQNKEYTIYLKIKELLIRHTGIFGITGSGKSTTVGHLVNELIKKNIPVLLFDVHRDYITTFENPVIITFDSQEKDFLAKLLEEKGKAGKVVVGKLELKVLRDYMEEILGISGKQASHVYKLLSTLLGLNPKTVNELLNWLEKGGDNKKAIEIISKAKDTAIESLKSRIYRISDWRLFRRNVDDSGEDLLKLLSTLLEKLREGKIDISSECELTEDGEALLKKEEKPLNVIIVDLYPLSAEEQKIILDILLEKIYNTYKNWKFKGKADVLGIVVEEAHRFSSRDVKASTKISLIAREGRKFGLGLLLVTQIPSKIQEDIISQINTFLLLKIINPRDLEFIRKTCPYLSREYFEALTKLETGKCLTVGLATKNPAIVKIIKDVEVGGAEEDIERRIKERIVNR